ncbi:Cupin 2 conserved barrel domain protein [Desulfobulbus propionicus DSM 2032]|jgi:Mannose-6-phosphate isomerase|uniref:Cupin 2 conserved barrel domain protein n=1 Tax=Desulfobulbus propionicus (strain ATCC 33891 / DSM 2032 / VKM B-1956 / 1pr3) TaxID=577650 RepID=A0A7U3YPH6_DESPD|nr:cupin domain-containing protein [Desulfobulbus propionicus]ADW19150.1 Cupin 2 conserved barrel domain protein [Desulfobulbus propionicus DSM 2032]
MSDEEYYFEEGCFILELHNTPDDPAVSVARARVAAGQSTRWHGLEGIQERYLLLEGNGLVEVGDEPPRQVQAGDVVLIPPGCRQRITNIGHVDLLFLAVCTPRFLPAAYRDLDQQRRESKKGPG